MNAASQLEMPRPSSRGELINAALEERIDAYRKARVTRTYVDQTCALTEWRRTDHEARSVPVSLQRATLKRLDGAYRAFFRRLKQGQKPGFPRYRGRGWFDSFGFQEFSGISWRNGKLRFKGFPGMLRVHLHRPLPEEARIRSCTFRRDAKGWFVGFVIELPLPPPRHTERAVGLDLGITTFATLSDGGVIPNPKAAYRAERWLRVVQRTLSRKKRASKGRRKARHMLARCHAAIARRRTEHLRQATARLVRDYDLIVIEKLDIKGLARSMLAKAVHDAGWSKFTVMLRHKAESAGVRVISVDPHNTSQECSGCGSIVPKRLGDRRHECPQCSLSIDRDLNAARTILNRAGVGPGLRNVADCGKRASGNLSTLLDAGPLPFSLGSSVD